MRAVASVSKRDPHKRSTKGTNRSAKEIHKRDLQRFKRDPQKRPVDVHKKPTKVTCRYVNKTHKRDLSFKRDPQKRLIEIQKKPTKKINTRDLQQRKRDPQKSPLEIQKRPTKETCRFANQTHKMTCARSSTFVAAIFAKSCKRDL